MKKISEKARKIAEKVTSDGNQSLWESGQLGRDSKHAKKYRGKPLFGKTSPTSIRLPESMIEALKRLAEQAGVGYQSYLKMVLAEKIKEEEKKAS